MRADAIDFLEAIFGRIEPPPHVTAAAVEDAERRIGCRLPTALAALYVRTANAKALHASHNRLLPLAEIRFEGEYLVFYEENQSVVSWGIQRQRLGEDDPPVDQGQPGEPWDWYSEFGSVSEFACAQGAWQAVQGGLPFVANARGKSVRSELGPPQLDAPGMRAWLVDGGVFLHAGDEFLALATRTERQFADACTRVGIAPDEWDHA